MIRARRLALVALAIALVAPVFSTPLPPPLAAPEDFARKLFLPLALVLPLLGTVALHDAIFRKHSWWPLASAIVVYNAAFISGSVDFCVAIGCALLGAACWIRLQRRPWQQTAAVAAIAVPIYFAQASGLGFLLLMIGGFELHEAWQAKRLAIIRPRAARLALAALPAGFLFVHVDPTFGASPSLTAARSMWWTIAKLSPLEVAIGAGASFFTYDTGIDLLILIAVAAAFGALALGKKLSFSWPTGIAAALMLAYPFAPGGLTDAAWIDTRLPVLAGFLFFAGMTPKKLGRRETAVLAVAFAALIVARLGVIATAWQSHTIDLAHASDAPTQVTQADARTQPVDMFAQGEAAR